jgi:hypothetical protein
MKKYQKLCFTLLLITSLNVYAGSQKSNDSKFYASAGLANVEVDLGIGSTSLYTVDNKDSAPIVMLGYKIGDNLSLEGGMIGSIENSITTTSSITGTYLGKTLTIGSGLKITAKSSESWLFGGAYKIPMTDKLSLNTRAGLLFWDVDYKVSGTATYDGVSYAANATILTKDGSDTYFGIGGEYEISDGISAEFSYLDSEVNGDDVDSYNIALVTKF